MRDNVCKEKLFQLFRHLEALKAKHAEADTELMTLLNTPACAVNSAQRVLELKNQKCTLKCKMQAIEDQMQPAKVAPLERELEADMTAYERPTAEVVPLVQPTAYAPPALAATG